MIKDALHRVDQALMRAEDEYRALRTAAERDQSAAEPVVPAVKRPRVVN